MPYTKNESSNHHTKDFSMTVELMVIPEIMSMLDQKFIRGKSGHKSGIAIATFPNILKDL